LLLFARGQEARAVSSFTTDDIERWFRGRNEALSARASNLGRLSALFSYAVRRGWCERNPCDGVERVSMDPRPPRILTVREAARLMVGVKRRLPVALAWFALALFGGLRPSEVDRLSWSSVDLDRGRVTVDAAASKVRRRRIVHLEPAAVAWLRLAQERGAKLGVPFMTRRRWLAQARRVMRWKAWPQDILRHSAASYWLALRRDPGRVAMDLGNSPTILQRHYCELVSAEEAKRFWGLRPVLAKSGFLSKTGDWAI
jgi:integrase